MPHWLLVVALVGAGLTACSGDDDASKAPPNDDQSDQAQEDEAPRGESVAVPTEVTGPITGGTYDVPFNPLPERVADQYGYVEEEYFVTGTATSYTAESASGSAWGSDGKWAATPATEAPYTVRVLVRRPADAEAFNGTVLVEWLNVTAGMDADPDFGFTHDRLMQDGWAYVGVSAQKGGIEGDGALQIPVPGFEAKPLKEWDPERYGPLSHPGDAYSYDIFSQVAQLLRRPGDVGVDVLDGQEATTVIAAGESQSAMRMLTYVNAVHPLAQIYDGFLVHSRGNSGAPLGDDPTADPVPALAYVRDDLDQPVMQFETETDLFTLNFSEARQADTPMLRTWEVAGTAHADRFTVDYGVESGHEWAPDMNIDFGSLCGRLNEGPQGPVLRKAVDALRTWIVDGDAPAEATPIEIADGKIVRDDHGLAKGGIRTPAVDAPSLVLSGEREATGSIFCILFGSTAPLDPAVLGQLYPTHDDYVTAVTDAAGAAVEAGFLLEDDGDQFVTDAEAAPVPS
jgi:hypothetical protein